ncbi:hypothetical protein BDA96_02G032300 [Sorghum bicolor]|uniref:Uncharacterized protein n=2 Tax=Sorghum bicolor TaxID=4558 RepID=A0A1B6Q8Y7_SORBI|nr:uncharacterized protein LOC110432331 [Sorghum bicolor]XP_021308240.1 uncharacterized protein LOC110432344 [Sorghum bicolor]KAG0541619.1 hypothetical protein BDA96_02G032300 [Sorghum bicolor]KXG34388.1 hypothetical protein SORBI_3002G032000 [Sorghum bicolor]OQU88431.1 hypothetical protein SORBI_3002G032066 [Sorghum bicolor]|eukprot:XP_021308178.1 uncharacterized protein LOC110432331 [Sorghum bicolor]
MALRVLARKLRFPATSVLQRASTPVVSPPASSRLLTSHSSQSGGAKRAVNETRNARPRWRNYKKLEKRFLRDMEKDMKNFKELSLAMDNLPRNVVLTSSVGLAVLTTGWAYAIGVFDWNRMGDSEPSDQQGVV